MITIYILNAILIGHYLADFLFQNQSTKKKNDSLLWMLLHSGFYTLIFGVVFYAATYELYVHSLVLEYIILNGVLHYGVDVLTSVVKKQGQRFQNDELPDNGFFTTVGFDQLLHMLILFHTFNYMFN